MVAGAASIGAPEAGQLLIDQASQRAVIDWTSFSIGAGGRVHFANGQGATLNRVLGGDPSSIAGQLSASGSLYLINPAGVLIGPEGRVLTGGGFVASTRDVAPAAFMGGAMTLDGSSPAGVVNAGRIEAGGDVVLIGQVVDNRGSIRAGGQAALLAADRVVLREAAGDARIHIEHVAGGTGDVTTAGRIEAAAAELRAVGGNVYALAADTGGLVRATGAVSEGGRIRLVGGQGVTVAGTLDASGTTGGAIEVTAPGILVAGGARIAAAGLAGDGGNIKIGGERMGAPGLAAADRLLVEADATIDAGSATARGGEVILWSEQWTRFEGLIRADGPAGGGFVETSSKGALAIEAGSVEVGNGQWLLDPRNVNITTSGFNPVAPYPNPFQIDPPNAAGTYTINRTAIQNALNAGSDVIVTTNQPLRADPGNITVTSTISWSGTGSLTLLADNNIVVTASITSTGAGSLTLDAANLVDIQALIQATGTGNLTFIGRGAGVTFSGSGNRAYSATGGAISIQAPGATGDIIFGRTGSNGNWQMYAGGAGGLTLSAGRNIQLGRPLSATGWVRVGRDTDTGPVTITAGNQLSLLASPQSGVFAELRSGGAMTIAAPTVLVQSTPQADALVRAVGSQLTINATTATFNGPLQSTANTLLSGGAFSFSVSPTLNLAANNSFTLASGASLSSTVGLSIQTAGTGDIVLNGPVSGTTFTANSADELVIGAPINMSGSGNAILLHGGRRLVNNAGASPLNAPNGRWLTYSVSPYDDIGWELLNPDAPNLYGRSFGFFPPVSLPGTGNRRIYSFTPVLTYTADSGSRVYGDPSPALGVSISGLVPGDNLADAVIGTPTVSSAGFALAAPVGSYATVPGGVVATEQGYAIAFVNGVLTVTPAPLLVAADSLSKVYGDPDPALTFAASGFRLGDTAATVLSGALARAPGETVAGGPYAIGQGTLAANANYSISFVPGSFTITPAPLTVAAIAQTKVYGDPDPALTFTASGFRLGDTAASVLTGALTRDPGENVGSYGILQGTLAANSNYSLTFTGAAFTITPAVLRIEANDRTKVYGDPDPALTFTASGFRLGDTAAILTGALARDPGENVGSYGILQGTLAATPNYTIDYVPDTFTITPATLSVVADALSKVYGDPDPALTFAASGFRLGDTAASVLTGSLARAPGETVAGGPYAITQGTLAANANYTLAFTGNFLTITPAPLSVAALASAKIYGDPDPVLGFTASGFRLGDTIASLSGSLTRDPGETVGGYAIRLGTLANPNYAIDFTGATFTISPALLRIIAAAQSREYGLPDPALTFVAEGFRFDDTAASVLTGALVRAAGETVGFYAITQGTLAATVNYTIDFTGAALQITPAPLDIVANPATKVYGDADPALAFAATGFRLGDTVASVLTGALARSPGETVAGSPYAIVQGTLAANPNYAIRFTGAGFTITPRPLTATLIGTVGRVYDATTLAPLAPANLQLAGVLPGDAVAVSAAEARYDTPNVGTGKLVTATGLALTGAAAGNYSLAGTTASAAIGTITPAPLTAVALDAERPFGLPNPPFQLQLTGLRGQDTAASIGLSAASAATLLSPPGRYAIDVLGNPLNYTVTRVPGTLTVLPALAFARTAPEQLAVPALGGLVQQGVGTGVNALNDTLDLGSGLKPAPQPILMSGRYTITVEPSPLPPGALGGASVFDSGAIRP
ncbi:MAG: MBG domain-containing protein [Sphingomonadaceae bacterium]